VSNIDELNALAPRSRRGRTLAADSLLPLLTFVALVGLWWLATIVFDWETFIVPAPPDVADALWENRELLPGEFWTTLAETLQGFALAIVVAIPLAVGIAYSRTLERTIYPVILTINAVPKVAIAPILVIWLGFGQGPKVAMVFLICFFPIVLSTATGLATTPPDLAELVRSLSASRMQEFVKVRFPAALPHVFVGLKVAISLAVIGAVIGEFVGASRGLGYIIIASGGNANTSLAFAAIVLLAVMSIGLFYAIVAIERLVIPWARYENR
jgi:NitT/TauT family transport system permease protein